MSYSLVKVRECDGSCCKESPRYPNADSTDCIYRTNSDQSRGCSLMNPDADLDSLPPSPCMPDASGKQCVTETCLNYPHNTREGRSLGNCCWQWVKNGD